MRRRQVNERLIVKKRPFAIFANFQVQLSLLLGEQKLPTEDDSILFNFPNVNDLDHAAGFDSTRANSSESTDS